MIKQQANLDFRKAATEEERQRAYRLRYQAMLERQWISDEPLKGGIDHDDADDEACQLLALDGDQLVGTMRLVVNPQHVERELALFYLSDLLPIGGTGLIGRFVVARGSRQHARGAYIGLCALALKLCNEFGIVRLVTFAEAAAVRYNRRLGMQLKVLGPKRAYAGADRYPLLVDWEVLNAFLERLPRNDRDAFATPPVE